MEELYKKDLNDPDNGSVTQSCLTLCDPMDCSPPGSSVHGIFLARVLEWIVISYSRGSSWPRNPTHVSWVSFIGKQIVYQLGSLYTHTHTHNAILFSHKKEWKKIPFAATWIDLKIIIPSELSQIDKDKYHLISLMGMHAKSLQSCPTLCDPVDYSPPGSSVHGTLQARILTWVAMPSFRGSSQPRDWTHISYVFNVGMRVLYH